MWIVRAKLPDGTWASSTGFVNAEHVCSYMVAMGRNGCENFTVKIVPDNQGIPVQQNGNNIVQRQPKGA